jgi:hypothetical protein
LVLRQVCTNIKLERMTVPETVGGAIFQCELGRDEVREVMAASGIISLLRRSWLMAGVLFAALLAAAVMLLRTVAVSPAAGGSHHELLVAELAAGSGLCALLVLWSAQRVWRLSPGRQASRALVSGVWQRGVHEYKLLVEGVAWHCPDGSATFLPWSALTGVRETKRLFLLLDQEGRHVRGFIPKAGLAHLPPEVAIVRLIRDQITTAKLSAWFTPEQRVAPQQVATVAHAGKQGAGGLADLAPGHVGVLDRGARTALVVDGAVEQVDGHGGQVGREVGQ